MSRKGREGQRKEEERETGKAQKSRFKKKRPDKKQVHRRSVLRQPQRWLQAARRFPALQEMISEAGAST